MSGEEFVERNQRFTVYLAMGLILWVFSLFLFHPLIVTYAYDWAGLISVLLVVAISYYLIMAKIYSGPVFNYVSNRLTTWWINWRKLDTRKRQTHQMNTRKVLKTGTLLLVYLLYSPLLHVINRAMPGLTLILVLVYLLKIILEQK